MITIFDEDLLTYFSDNFRIRDKENLGYRVYDPENGFLAYGKAGTLIIHLQERGGFGVSVEGSSPWERETVPGYRKIKCCLMEFDRKRGYIGYDEKTNEIVQIGPNINTPIRSMH